MHDDLPAPPDAHAPLTPPGTAAAPSLLVHLWGPDHGMAQAEVEAVTGHPALQVAPGLIVATCPHPAALTRLAYSRAVMEYLGESATLVPPFDPMRVVSGSFAVNVRTVRGASVSPRVAAREAAGYIWRRLDAPRVNLDQPDTEIRVFVTPSGAVWGRQLYSIAPQPFAARSPRRRPFWRSIAIAARQARWMVNLCDVRAGQLVLDPFCGTASIPIEAALMGMKTIASDVDPVVAAGARRNLSALSLDVEVRAMDAREWAEAAQRFDAIVSDLPYGRSASIKGVDRGVLYAGFLETAGHILNPGGRAVLMAPKGSLPIAPATLRVTGRHEEYVHGGLTREITVLQRTHNSDE